MWHASDMRMQPNRKHARILLELALERVDGTATISSARLLPTWTEHGAVHCAGRPARVRAILLGPAAAAAEADPAYRGCGAHYRERIATIRNAVGSSFVD